MFKKRKSKTLLAAAAEGQAGKVKSLLDGGADPNYPDTLDRTALMMAAEEGHKSIAQYLIRAGADVNSRSKLRESALMFAAKKGSQLEILLSP